MIASCNTAKTIQLVESITRGEQDINMHNYRTTQVNNVHSYWLISHKLTGQALDKSAYHYHL